MIIGIKTGRPILLWHSATDRHRLEPSPIAAALFLETGVAEVRRLVDSGEENARGWTADYADPRQVEMFESEARRARLDRERLERSRKPRTGYHRLG